MWESIITIKISFFVVLNLLKTYVETFSTNKGPNLYGCIGGSGYHKIAGLQFYFFILVLCWWRLFFLRLFFFALLFRFHFFPFLRAFFFLFLLLILLIIWNVNQWVNTLCVSLKHLKIHILKFLPKNHGKYHKYVKYYQISQFCTFNVLMHARVWFAFVIRVCQTFAVLSWDVEKTRFSVTNSLCILELCPR